LAHARSFASPDQHSPLPTAPLHPPPPASTPHLQVDLRDRAGLQRIFKAHTYHSVIHFAAFKAVGESRQIPLTYYDNNLSGTITLLQVMAESNCKKLVFSSSCTVYGDAPSPLSEESTTGGVTNAYAATKYMMEQILLDVARCDPTWAVVILRYFNPVGAHPSGTMGEDPRGIPNCLVPYMLQVLVGRLPKLTVFGTDYDTRDGTCIRDYIHVMDVARGHIDAITYLEKTQTELTAAGKPAGFVEIFNFGTGNGTTVLELLAAMQKAAGREVTHVLGPRRAGDVPAAYANPAKAERVLGWKPQYSIEDMCRDAWLWQSKNPNGYATEGAASTGAGAGGK
jgi:UDP-glucose 4-epimerase